MFIFKTNDEKGNNSAGEMSFRHAVCHLTQKYLICLMCVTAEVIVM